ncbi:M81 family metallopeptidase [Allopusillimonas ginsengisoli]|uniref:M81 family metallopeptidase n=1 Tax=Allopusillimonas ginsengisoli TaxID=453575 RepID=UPI0014308E35|nr:M81 family metallopeptidase [Allopusillimonas ginsengisoli]
MKIAVGGILFEGNTFTLSKTTIQAFHDTYYFEGGDMLSSLRGGEVEVSGALSVFDAAGAEVHPLIATHGGAGGMVTRECFEELKERLLAQLGQASVDGVYLALHGAMICEQTDNAEVELLQAVRDRTGAVPLVISCDLHAHITPAMVELCDAIVGYQHYPHDDAFETGARAAGLLISTISKATPLKLHMTKLAMLVSPTMAGTRNNTPMREAYKASRALEALPGVLSVSYFPSTPWAERKDGGTAFVMVSDGSLDSPETLLSKVVTDLWKARDRFEVQLVTLDEALEGGRAVAGKPVVLSEMSDAVGAGAAGDSAYVLDQYLSSGAKESLLVQIVDSDVVEQAKSQGVGAFIECRIGNKIENRHGGPVTLSAQVISMPDGRFTYKGGPMAGARSTVGHAAVLRSGNVTILVTSRSAYEYADEQYAAAGIDIRGFKFVVVKNPMNYRQAYSWAPRLYALDTPGAGRADLQKLNWTICARPFYPLDDSEEPLYRY